MTREKFITHQQIATPKRSRISMIISNILLLAGSLVIVLLLGYLLFNLDKSDSLVNSLMPFFFVGIGLIIVSQVICPFQFKLRR
jgi:hypothetical protein